MYQFPCVAKGGTNSARQGNEFVNIYTVMVSSALLDERLIEEHHGRKQQGCDKSDHEYRNDNVRGRLEEIVGK